MAVNPETRCAACEWASAPCPGPHRGETWTSVGAPSRPRPGLTIYDATVRARDTGGVIVNPHRTYRLTVEPGSVYRNEYGEEVQLDARDVLSTAWAVLDE